MPVHAYYLILLVFLAAGCGHRPYYGLTVLNRTGQRCREIVIEFGGRTEHFPGGLNGNIGISGGYPNPSPAQAKVRWTTESGDRHEQTVKFKSLKGAALGKVDYVFVIRYDGTAEAAPFTHAEKMRNLDAQLACGGGPAYMVGVKNLTSRKLDDVEVRFGEFQVNAGSRVVMGPEYNDGWSITYGLPYPVTDAAQIQWKTADGAPHTAEVALRPGIPDDLNGVCICFLLGDAPSASMRAVPFDELRAGKYPELHPGWKLSSETK